MNKKFVIISISIAILVVAIITGSSYAYFSALNQTGSEEVITSGNMALTLTDGAVITTNSMVPGDYIEKEFSVENTGNVASSYDIYLSEVINNFVDQTDLVYEIISLDGGYNTVSPIQVPNVSTKIINNQSIGVGVTHHYKLKITFLSKNENQDDNQGKSFSAKIQVNEYQDKYLLTFNVNGGTGLASTTAYYIPGETYTLPTPIAPEGYSFDGWYTQATGGTKINSVNDISSSINLFAHYTINTYTLTYNNEGGSGCTTKQETYGNNWGTLCEPTRQGYTFEGWYTGQNGTGTEITSNTVVSNNQEVHANWEQAPLILYNNGPVDGYTWVIHSQSSGTTVDLNTGIVNPNNNSWCAVILKLSGINFTGYSKFHIELSTGAFLNNNPFLVRQGNPNNDATYGTGAPTIISYKVDNQDHVLLEGDLASPTSSIYLIFPRGSNSDTNKFQIHKIWVD